MARMAVHCREAPTCILPQKIFISLVRKLELGQGPTARTLIADALIFHVNKLLTRIFQAWFKSLNLRRTLGSRYPIMVAIASVGNASP